MHWILGGVLLAGLVVVLMVAAGRSRARRGGRRDGPPDAHRWDDTIAQRATREGDAPANLDTGGDDDG